jgi:hypothetical protein
MPGDVVAGAFGGCSLKLGEKGGRFSRHIRARHGLSLVGVGAGAIRTLD